MSKACSDAEFFSIKHLRLVLRHLTENHFKYEVEWDPIRVSAS